MRKKRTRKLSIILSLWLILAFSASAQIVEINDLERNFQNPPDDSRIMMRWWWFGPSVTKAELERELKVMKQAGIGGVEIQPVYALLPDDEKAGIKNLPYLSDEFLEMLRFTSDKTRELGMRMDLTLGSGWSFGGAKTPITEAAGQIRVERVKINQTTKRIPLPSIISAEKILGTFLSKNGGNTGIEKDLVELTDIRDGAVYLSPKVSGAEILFFISGKSGMQVKRPSVGAEGYVLNHLDKLSVDNYLKNTGDRLFTAFDKNNIPFSVFCDSLEVYNQDWTDDFLTEFQKRRGYDLRPLLPHLVMNLGEKTPDIRYDWGRTITELFNERFMIPMQAWSKQNGTRFRIQGYGIPPAAISSNAFADISDGEGAQWKVVRAARWASSANHIYGRPITSSETWTWLHSPVFRATPLDLKAEADIHFLQGINQLIGHGWGYTPPQVEYPGWRFYAAGAYSEQNPWWIVMPDLANYLQRLSFLLRQGNPKNDVALYLPNADAYANFSAGKVHLIEAERELVGEKLMPEIFKNGYNLDFFDDEILKNIGQVEKNNLILGASNYSIVILPGIERIPLESLKKLDEFVENGGILVATRRLPQVVPGFKSTAAEQKQIKEITQRLFEGANAKAKFVADENQLGSVLKAAMPPDVDILPANEDLHFVHRQTSDADVYFLANTSNTKQTVEAAFRTNGEPELWNAMNGASSSITPIAWNAKTRTLALTFEPYQSHIVVFTKRQNKTMFQQNSTVVSTTDLSADWQVAVGNNKPAMINQLSSWTDDETTKYFSGTAVYEKNVDVTNEMLNGGKSMRLDFGEGKALPVEELKNGMRTWLDAPIREAAEIYVNDQRAGAIWSPPYSLDIKPFLKNGTNKIRVVVGNTALNYMAGRSLPNYKLLNLRYGERFQPQDMDKIQVLPSGILGNIRLISIK